MRTGWYLIGRLFAIFAKHKWHGCERAESFHGDQRDERNNTDREYADNGLVCVVNGEIPNASPMVYVGEREY